MSAKDESTSTETAPLTQRQKLFTFNPPPFQRKHSLSPIIASAPLHFLDRHIPEFLILKRIRIISSLHRDLYNALEAFAEPLDALPDEEFTFHPFLSYDMTDSPDALSILNIRTNGLEVTSSQIASSLVLHPNQPDAISFLRWYHALEELKPTLLHDKYATQYFGLRVMGGSPEEYERLNRKNRTLLKRVYKRMRQLSSPLILCTDALPVLEDMTRLGAMDSFPWRLDSHYHGTSRPRSPPPDALKTLWTLPDDHGPRRSRRVKQASQRSSRPDDTIGLPDIAEKSGDGEYKPLCEDYIQKAWVASVKLDTTILTFDCGNFLRFGVRHRQSQTLFLSDLIDIRTCKDPSYGGLLLALDIAAAFDAVNRLPLLESHSLGKRKSTTESSRPKPKRRKTMETNPLKTDEDTTSYIASFCAVAVFFRFDEFESPAPLLLSKPGSDRKSRYAAKDYLTLMAAERIGYGSIGDVYRVTIEGDSDETDFHPFIMKIAFTQNSVQRLRHEERVYRHLQAAGVAGIPSLLAFLENPDASLCALFLSDCGSPLGERMVDRKVDLSPKAQEDLTSILASIHDAGILHRDVRSWNILEDLEGRVRFTDFDRGSFQGRPKDYLAEKQRLERFLQGEFVDRFDIIGKDDLGETYPIE